MKYAYIIPGFFENADTRKAYRKIAALFRKQGYKPIIVNVKWKYRTMSDYIKQFNSQLKENVEGSIFLGFSFGAYIAFVSATENRPKQLLLCSLSPYFKEDINPEFFERMKKTWMKGFKKRIEDCKKFEFNKLAPKVNSKTIIFIGSKEAKVFPALETRAKDAHKRIRGSKLVVSKGSKHDIGDPFYFEHIKHTIENLK